MAKMYINSCYNGVYLYCCSNIEQKNYQLLPILGMHYAGVGEYISNIYDEYARLSVRYTSDYIKDVCIETEPIMSHIHILNISDFMSEFELGIFNKMNILKKKEVLTSESNLINTYENPKLVASQLFPKKTTTATTVRNYQFPFKKNKDVLGGRKSRKSRKSKKSKSNSKSNSKKSKSNKIR